MHRPHKLLLFCLLRFLWFYKNSSGNKGFIYINVGLWLIHLTIFLLFYMIVYNYIHDDDCDLDIQMVS